MGVLRSLSLAAAIVLLVRMACADGAQQGPSTMVLASAELPSVIELPVYFRLYRARLPAGRRTSYRGSSAMLYGLSGTVTVAGEEGVGTRLNEGGGLFVAAGRGVVITTPDAEPADLLLFILSALPNQKPPLDRPAVVKELCRTGEPLPGLQPGAYDLTLTRVTYPPGTPIGSPHYHTGAALDYVLAGSAALIAKDQREKMPAGSASAALAGWFHQWVNEDDAPLVLIEAAINQKGAAPIVPDETK